MMSQYNYNSVFADFLSVTFNPDHFDVGNLRLLLLGCGYEHLDSSSSLILFNRPNDPLSGLIRVEAKFNHVRISASGKALAYLRKLQQYENYLLHLSEFPHRITRLDTTMDSPRDFPSICRSISRHYPDDRVCLSRKATKITYNLSKRDDGLRSGSLYMGNTRDKLQIIIYDKALEMLDKLGLSMPPTSRYEMRFNSSFNLTLRDALDPTELFWSYSDMVLLKKPSSVPERTPTGDLDGWSRDNCPALPFSKLSDYIDHSAALDSMITLADALGSSGRTILERLLIQRLKSAGTELFGAIKSKSGIAPAKLVGSRKEDTGNVISLEELQQRALKNLKEK